MNISLDIGFRFLPPDEEIINYFLLNKLKGYHDRTRHIREVELVKQEPWELAALSIIKSRYAEWLFFYKLNKISEGRNDRATEAGYWKSTGQDRVIRYGGRVIGTKKSLVFYKGRTPRGVKTDWIMHEYRATADFVPRNADSSYAVGCLRNKAAENSENSISNDGQPSTHFAASSSRNNAVRVKSMEINNMDYEIAWQTQMEDQDIFDYDLDYRLSQLNDLFDSAVTNNDQNRMEGISLEDLPPYDDLVDDEQNEWQHQFDTTIEEERNFMTSLFPGQDHQHSYAEVGHPLRRDYRAPYYAEDSRDTDPKWANAWCDPIVRMSGQGHSKGFNQQRMENGVRHDEILIMDSTVDSATVTAYENDCHESVREEQSVNSRTCKSQYEPRSHMSVVQRHPTSVELQVKSSGRAVSRDMTRESSVRCPVVELVQNKKSIVQSNKGLKMDRDRNAKLDLNSTSKGSADSVRKRSFNYLVMSQLSSKPNPPLVHVGNVLLGVILFIVVVREVMFLR
ncbi:NAC domain-containing protein 45-like isoform X2 [Durio zibethinus]|uniref:NAC domain-containing protein 45-like isoform X2 n=1 Tax=Durio zibethinus TaxID=66656 RepID=A0A6P6B101_DURZI|nr:NAC domain-containing protein 45-like isoform X2 [Durio zibethinus]